MNNFLSYLSACRVSSLLDVRRGTVVGDDEMVSAYRRQNRDRKIRLRSGIGGPSWVNGTASNLQVPVPLFLDWFLYPPAGGVIIPNVDASQLTFFNGDGSENVGDDVTSSPLELKLGLSYTKKIVEHDFEGFRPCHV